MKKFNVGVLGFGKMGKVHAHWFSQNPNCNLVAVYNRTSQRTQEVLELFPVARFFSSWEKLVMDKSIDVVTLATPPHEHLDQIILALKHGKHVFCEKPLALDIHQCRTIIEAASETNSIVKMDSQLPYHPVMIKVDELIGRIGRIHLIELDYAMYRQEITWKHQLTDGGGVLRELGGHLIDLICNWLGEAMRVTGFNRIFNSMKEVEDYSQSIIEFRSGAIANVTAHYFDRSGRLHKGRIFGEKGQIDFQWSSYRPEDSKIILYDSNGLEIRVEFLDRREYSFDTIYPGFYDSFGKIVSSFVDDIQQGVHTSDSLEKEYRTMEIINASYESQRTRSTIGLPLLEYSLNNLQSCFEKQVGGDK